MEQTDGSLKIKDTYLSKIKDVGKDNKPTASFDPKRPSRSNLPDSIIFYKDKLCDNTVEELKYYCKQNLLSVSGTKSFLMSRVFSDMKNRKLHLIQLTVRKPVKQNTTQPPKAPASNKSNSPKARPQAVPVALPAKDIQARKVLLQNNVARISVAEINLPGIEQGLSIQDIKIVSNQPISCPFKLKTRPCEQ